MKPTTNLLKPALLLFVLSFFLIPSFSQVTLIPYGSSWKYWTNSQANYQPTWETAAYDDSGWPSGTGELGYGDGDEGTCIPSGGSGGTPCMPGGNKWVTAYFRKKINIANPLLYSAYTFNVERDDGYVVYINGLEVARDNMPGGAVSWATSATTAIEDGTVSFTLPNTAFIAGDNVIAVEVHQGSVVAGPPISSSSTDLSFNLELTGSDAFTAALTRGPYLQMGNQTAITIHWKTSTLQNSRVEIGTSFGTYPTVVSNATNTTDHIIRVTGLTADTKYYYRIGNSTNMGIADAQKFFATAPPPNTTRKIRIAAFGDCGKNAGNNSLGVNGVTYQTQSLAQYQSFLTSNSIDAPDAWLLLGDNAYDAGQDAEYTTNFFGSYGSTILKNHKLFPVPGNHDYANDGTRQDDHVVPYYSIFDLPSGGECGGLASTKEEYYSYDIGNIHFLALDAYGEEANKRLYTAGSAQAAWVTNDLAANTKKWTVVYFHHPPYTMGSHNSDGEGDLVAMRSNFISILENAGVDLVINGHSHDYERSYLMKGHYGLEGSFVLSGAGKHAVTTSNGKYTSTTNCPYIYNSTPAYHGTVYVLAGSTGASGNTQAGYPHNALPFAVNDGGFFYFEVEDNRLDAKFIERDGTVFDNFTILKDVNKTTNYTINNGSSQILAASWPGNYNWNTTATTKTITVMPPNNAITNYTVNDVMGCITDQFSITTSNPLPVNLLDYQVQLKAGKVYITWSTSEETNSKDFTVERTQNTTNYEIVSKVNAMVHANGKHNYSVTDNSPYPGISYYRLSQTDQDGKTAYYDLKKITNKEATFSARQVMGASGSLLLEINSAKSDKVKIKIFDLSGKQIWKEDLNVFSGTIQKGIKLKAGSYAWEIKNSQGESVSQVGIVK